MFERIKKIKDRINEHGTTFTDLGVAICVISFGYLLVKTVFNLTDGRHYLYGDIGPSAFITFGALGLIFILIGKMTK